MCSESCASKHSNHSVDECEILSRCSNELRPEVLKLNKDKEIATSAYSVITPLRMLLLQELNKDEWKRSDQLMDHLQGSWFKKSF